MTDVSVSKKIQLTNGGFAIVDDEDYQKLNNLRWYKSYYGYAVAYSRNQKAWLSMHRYIMCTPKGMHTDHLNHDKLDNRKANLRVCTPAEHNKNQILRTNNRTGYRGVCYYPKLGRWRAYANINKRQVNLGYFDSLDTAAECARQFRIANNMEFI